MICLSYRDYFTTTGTGEDWTVTIKSCEHKIIKDYHDELLHAANIIYTNSDAKLILLFSGGLDSEFMINIFRKAKIPFQVAIISYGKYNKHDTEYAFKYCSNNGITPIIVDIDIKHFIESGKILEIAKSVNCCAYQMPSIMYGISKLEGTVIMANGEPYLKNYNGIWKYQETERVNSYMRWYNNQGIVGTPDFLRYTPESTLAFLKEPRVQELIANRHPGKLSTRTSKHIIYSKNYNFEPRKKFTGWEIIEKTSIMENEIFLCFEDLKKEHNGVFEIETAELIDMLI